jgi:hypothetical protein
MNIHFEISNSITCFEATHELGVFAGKEDIRKLCHSIKANGTKLYCECCAHIWGGSKKSFSRSSPTADWLRDIIHENKQPEPSESMMLKQNVLTGQCYFKMLTALGAVHSKAESRRLPIQPVQHCKTDQACRRSAPSAA